MYIPLFMDLREIVFKAINDKNWKKESKDFFHNLMNDNLILIDYMEIINEDLVSKINTKYSEISSTLYNKKTTINSKEDLVSFYKNIFSNNNSIDTYLNLEVKSTLKRNTENIIDKLKHFSIEDNESAREEYQKIINDYNPEELLKYLNKKIDLITFQMNPENKKESLIRRNLNSYKVTRNAAEGANMSQLKKYDMQILNIYFILENSGIIKSSFKESFEDKKII